MAYSAEILRRAQQQLASAKADRESLNQQRLAQAYRQEPRLKEIDLQLRRSMALAAQAVFTQGGDARAAMEQVKNANLALQKERQALIDSRFEPGFLEEAPICAVCGGSGWVGANMCRCLAELCRREQKRELARLTANGETFRAFRLDYYSAQVDGRYGASPRTIMERNLQICRRYAESFDGSGSNLLFVGGTGLGKTFLSACVARAVADRGYSVVYETASHLFAKLEQAKFNPSEEARREAVKFQECDLLIIDDLGTEMPGQFVTASLYSLLNDRILMGKPMVISTNLNVEEMSRRYSPQIASRLHGGFQRLTFVGEDIRILKNRGY